MRIMAIDYGDASTGWQSQTHGACWLYHRDQSRKPDGWWRRWPALRASMGWTSWLWASPGTWTAQRAAGGAISRPLPPGSGKSTGLEPVLWDERRTTMEAHDILHASGKQADEAIRKPWMRWRVADSRGIPDLQAAEAAVSKEGVHPAEAKRSASHTNICGNQKWKRKHRNN